MNDIGVSTRWVSLEELLGAIDPPLDASDVKVSGHVIVRAYLCMCLTRTP